ncbi:MAG: right-handed parallel beta-helix repeat-containing protein [Deltaproteobacteria bacterium]|nr:right-handed parallel beta-helix repeat-containing protein [Deltaproteobacteria bacterium]
MRTSIIVGSMLCLVAGTAYAKDYYVAPTGKDDAAAGTQASPWKTITYAANQVLPGDTVIVQAGTYAEVVLIDKDGGASGIRFQAASGAAVVINGNNTLPAVATDALVSVNGKGISFEGFDVRGSKGVGLMVSGDNHKILNCKIHDNAYGGIAADTAIGVQISGNTVYKNQMFNAAHNQTGVGPGVAVGASEKTEVANNTIYNNHGQGLAVTEGKNNVVRGNTLYDNLTDNVYVEASEAVTIARNFIYCTTDVIWQTGGNRPGGISLSDDAVTKGHKVMNNIVSACGGNFAWYPAISGAGLKNSLIANNTFSQAQNVGITIEQGAHASTTIANNIVIQSNTQVLELGASGPYPTFASNNWLGGTPPAAGVNAKDVTGVNCNLININDKKPDGFKIPSGSPCVDKGTTLADVKDDYFGAARPQGAAYDIGAHEYGGAVTPDAGPPRDGGVKDGRPTVDGTVPPTDGTVVKPDGAAPKPDGGVVPKADGGTTPQGDGGTSGGGGCSCELAERPTSLWPFALLGLAAALGLAFRRRRR